MTTWLIGDGPLMSAVEARVSADVVAVPSAKDAVPSAADLVIACDDEGDIDAVVDVQRRARGAGARMLTVRLDGGLGLVGPWVLPGRRGCLVCSEKARQMTLVGDADVDADELVSIAPVWAPHVIDLVAEIVGAAVVGDEPLGPLEVYVVRARDLSGRRHDVHPIVGCTDCGTLPDDSAALARVDLTPTPQHDPESFRIRPDGHSVEELRDIGYDWRFGPIRQVYRDESSPLALVAARVVPIGGGVREDGYGRSTSYAKSEVIALYEALERIATATPTSRRTVVRGSERDLDAAVDIAGLGLHDPSWYDHPHFEPVPHDPGTVTDWVWGWRMNADEPVLVPEHVAYYDVDGRDRDVGPRLLYESSSGAALGGSLEEAVLYGLFEVIERDAFLMMWYGRLSAPRLRVTGMPLVDLGREQIDELGYDLLLFDITNDLQIPAVASLAVRRDGRSPVAFFAAGAHCDPRRAVHNAVAEVVTNVVLYPRRSTRDPEEHDRDRLLRLLGRPEDVVSLEDHIAVYTLPEATERYAFLLGDDRDERPLEASFAGWRERWVRPDLTEVLRGVLGVLGDAALDPIVVNETPDGLGARGLHAVKTIVPGTIPMTFGGVHHRVRGLDRLETVPVQLGHWSRPGSIDDLPIHVHPFP